MGVDGFWPIVSSKGKRVTLEILSDKIIAVDASIWIYQFANALRDAATGEQVRASHIVGFFKRICKLLFLRIKPVFVFDGPPIPLKFAALRKRHDDSVPDSVFRKAAQQILIQNLQLLRNDPTALSAKGLGTLPERSKSDDSIDEIHVVTDSSSEDGLSPSRRLRLTVPEEFRGFVAERRTLDSVTLPYSPVRDGQDSRKEAEVEIDAKIDEEALKGLPFHEQYRALLQTRSALLSQGRRKALNLATRMGSAAGSVDLDKLSADQIRAVVDLAKVTDMSRSVRMQMAVDENKEEVYVAPSMEKPSSSSSHPKEGKRRKRAGQVHVNDWMIAQKHSILSTARTANRTELLFDSVSGSKLEEEKEMKHELSEADVSEEEWSEEFLQQKLFGDAWNDLKIPSSVTVQEPINIDKSGPSMVEEPPVGWIERGDPSVGLIDTRNFGESNDPPIEPPVSLIDSEYLLNCSSESDDSIPSVVADKVEIEVSSDSSGESVRVDSFSESESESSQDNFPVDQGSGSLSHEESAVQEGEIMIMLETVSDEDLRAFAELQDPFPNPAEEERFDSTVREKILEDSENTYEEIQELLTAFGIPWVSAPADAEAQCAFLCANGLVDGVISDDSDTLIYGSPIVFRHLYMGESTVELFKQSDLGFSRDQLISLALLLGCDFTEGVRGIGPVNATEIVRHYSGLEQLKLFRDWAESIKCEDSDSELLTQFKIAHANYRSQWIFPSDFPSPEVWATFNEPAVNTDLDPFSWVVPEERLVAEVVCRYSDMREEQVDSLLIPTMKQYRCAKIQRRITDYFSPAFQRGSVAQVVSKRLLAALPSPH